MGSTETNTPAMPSFESYDEPRPPQPEAPNPAADAGIIPPLHSLSSDQPPPLDQGVLDIDTISPEAAMRLLCQSIDALRIMTGDVPPTPPVPRPPSPTPSTHPDPSLLPPNSTENKTRPRLHRRTPSAISSSDLKSPTFRPISLGSPEALAHEPIIIGHGAVPPELQHAAIARKFFSKRAPAISMSEYVERLQRFCPMSAAVWLAAGCYIYRLAVEDRSVPVTSRTVNRLVLAALRIAGKALEDVRFPHERFAGVGGVKQAELATLEVSFCYLMDFDLYVTREEMVRKTMALRDATRAGARLPASWQPKLPIRNRTNVKT